MDAFTTHQTAIKDVKRLAPQWWGLPNITAGNWCSYIFGPCPSKDSEVHFLAVDVTAAYISNQLGMSVEVDHCPVVDLSDSMHILQVVYVTPISEFIYTYQRQAGPASLEGVQHFMDEATCRVKCVN